jgi:membrane protease subunit HflK
MSLDQLTDIEAIKQHLPGGNNILYVAIAVFLIATTMSSVYNVEADSVGVVVRFGRYIKEVEPGLKAKLPFGIDRVQMVPIQRQLKQEFGFGTGGASNPHQFSSSSDMEKRMVTGDLNSALVEWIVQYRISNPVEFLFRVRNAEDTLRDISESVMREVVGDRTVDEVLTIGRQEIEAEALLKMQQIASKYTVGVSIDQVQLKNVNPPEPVQCSFNEVNQAQQEKEKLINEARREYNRSIPLAMGRKDQSVQEAEGYRLRRVNEAEGDATRFKALLAEYIKAPEVTHQRIYLETMQEVLPPLRSKIIIDQDAQSVLPLLQLNGPKGGLQ